MLDMATCIYLVSASWRVLSFKLGRLAACAGQGAWSTLSASNCCANEAPGCRSSRCLQENQQRVHTDRWRWRTNGFRTAELSRKSKAADLLVAEESMAGLGSVAATARERGEKYNLLHERFLKLGAPPW
jgi:hypothetical protein